MPSLAKLPSLTSIWQRPQMPRPPHTESMSTPRLRAAVSTGVPQANRPRRPDGMKAISALALALSLVTAKRRPLERKKKKLYHRDAETPRTQRRTCHPGENRDPPIRQRVAGTVDPGFRRDDVFLLFSVSVSSVLSVALW